MEKFKNVRRKLVDILDPLGFEVYPFKIGWYNDLVEKTNTIFKLPYDENSISFILISQPSMFEKAFVPFICKENNTSSEIRDPLDRCMKYCFNLINQEFPHDKIETIHDFELTPSRRPKILVQTAGHCAGAAYYYQRNDVPENKWPENKKIYGVSIHPNFGGWFALRGVAIFGDLIYNKLEKTLPFDILETDEKKIEALTKFNDNWQDWTYRDVIPVKEKYSTLQKEYFATMPKDRDAIIKKLKEQYNTNDLN